MKNKIEDLRNHLFATLEALQDADHPMDVARAKAIAEVAGVKAEVKFMEVTGGQGSGFIPEAPRNPAILPLKVKDGLCE